jgi:hypothetical protein
MRRRLFNAWCAVSLLLAAVLMAAYIVRLDVRAGRGSPATGLLREVSISADRGRLRCYVEKGPLPPLPALTEWYIHPRVRLFRPSETRFDVTGFDSHWLTGPGLAPGALVYLISCPLWFAMLFALASPGTWFIIYRRRLRREELGVQGFTVVDAKVPPSPDVH